MVQEVKRSKVLYTRMEEVTCIVRGTKSEELICLLEATVMARNLDGLRFQRTSPYRPTVQRDESLLSDVETISGGVDGSEENRPFRLLIGQLPALAALVGAPFDVECAAEVWEVGEVVEMRVFLGKAVWPV